MRTKRDIIIVLKSLNYSEADKILTVFGENFGKYSLFAKGIRKMTSKNRGNMQTLSVSKISFYQGKGMPFLTESEAVEIKDFSKSSPRNLERVLLLLNKLLPEGEPEPEVFKTLLSLIKKEFDPESINKFRILFLRSIGMLSDFAVCYKCENSGKLRFIDKRRFAMVCENCYRKDRDASVIDKSSLGEKPYASKEITKILDEYIRRILADVS